MNNIFLPSPALWDLGLRTIHFQDIFRVVGFGDNFPRSWFDNHSRNVQTDPVGIFAEFHPRQAEVFTSEDDCKTIIDSRVWKVALSQMASAA